MTTTEKPAAAGNSDFANERGAEEEGPGEVLFVGPSFPLFPLSAQPRTDISNEKSSDQQTIKLIFAPAAAALEIIEETGTGTGNAFANAGYNQDEPRVPAGQPGGGQWTSGDAAAADRQAKRMKEAKGFLLSAAEYWKIAQEEAKNAALALEFLAGDERKPHTAAAKSAGDLAEEMRRRAYILALGKEDDYRPLMLEEYGINNPELDKIAAYYAEKFNDQATLNWLRLQHPSVRPGLDANGLMMMALFPEGEAVEEASQAGSAAEKSAFEQTTNIEKGIGYSDGETAFPGGHNAGALVNRANEIHSALNPIAREMRTTAVLETNGGRVVAGGGPDLTPAQRALLGPGETAARLPGAHAEVTALRHAAQNGLTPQAIGVTRTICPECEAAIKATGGTLINPTTGIWPP